LPHQFELCRFFSLFLRGVVQLRLQSSPLTQKLLFLNFEIVLQISELSFS
jgi:hypothetical protein